MAKASQRFRVLEKLRKTRLDNARRFLAEIEGKLTKNKIEHDQIAAGRRELLGDSAITQGSIQGWGDFVGVQNELLRKNSDDRTRLEQEFERHRKWVAELNKELKIIEKITEKLMQKEAAQEAKRERVQEEQWVIERWNRPQVR